MKRTVHIITIMSILAAGCISLTGCENKITGDKGTQKQKAVDDNSQPSLANPKPLGGDSK